MTVYEVKLADQVDDDTRAIYEYIAFDLNAPEAAAAQYYRIEDKISELDKKAQHYSLYDKEPWRSRGLRNMAVDNFQVLYFADKKSKVVTVIGVLYHGRDIDKYLEDYSYEEAE